MPPSTPVFHVVYARLLCLMLAQRGIAGSVLLQPCGLTAAQLDHEHYLSATQANALVRQALKQTGQEDLSLGVNCSRLTAPANASFSRC